MPTNPVFHKKEQRINRNIAISEVYMLIGIPKEIKNHEYRVGATPGMVRTFVESGHEVLVETQAGTKIGFTDEMFTAAGATIVDLPERIYEAEMIIKVKEPQESEFSLLKEGQILFCYLHLAPDPIQTKNLIERKVIAIAYETVTDAKGRLPLLVPMSEIAGRISIQVGSTYLQMNHGGKGVLLGGIPGVLPANVTIIGGGIVGTEAARMAMGFGANVTIIDRDINRLRHLDALFGPMLNTLYSTSLSIEEAVSKADLVIGSVLIPGKVAPKLVTREMVQKMSPNSVIVDVAIDQGGCFETARPTTHTDPIYIVDGVIHYCVTNIPGACARTATQALTNATMNYALMIANKGYRTALKEHSGLRNGLNIWEGHVTNEHVAADLGYDFVAAERLL
jgi:alanine dehydrogenase